MKIHHISIKQYKNLRDFDCSFSDSNISAFIGNNGSGKSNLLEAITEVFGVAKNVSQKSNPNTIVFPDIYECIIDYECDGIQYCLQYDKPDVSILCKGKKLSKLGMEAALPETIMLYYAGETGRQKIIAQRTFDGIYNNRLKRSDNESFPGYKFMEFYSLEDLPLLLLVAAVYKGEYYEKLLNHLNCTEILLETSLLLKNPNNRARNNGSPDTYWGARGFVKSFLDELRRFVSTTMDKPSLYYMGFQDMEPIKETSANEGELFAKLKALKNAGYLESLIIKLRRADGEVIYSDDLSEGEKQLALLMLLTSFTADNHCLYLFDEFDAYLHLNWQRTFSQMLRDTNIDGHIIFTTHSPATISQLRGDELFIMKDGNVVYPESEIYNRALDEIMMEQMDVYMRAPEIEKLYDRFKQCIADRDKEGAEHIMDELTYKLDETDPLFVRMRIHLRRI